MEQVETTRDRLMGHNSDSDSESDFDYLVPAESVDCQPLETSSHDTSEEAEESQTFLISWSSQMMRENLHATEPCMQ